MKNANTYNNFLLSNSVIEENKESHSNTVNTNEHSNIDTNTNNRYEIPGYDTVCYWIEQSDVPEIDFMSELPCKMENRKEKNTVDGRIFIRGFIEGIALDVYTNGVSIRVSLPKLLLGNNIESIFLDEVKQAHDKISKMVGFSIYKGKVTRIDVSSTFIMLHPFNGYLMALGSLSRFNEENDNNNRYYFNSKKIKDSPIVLLFYNKLREQINKGIQIYADFQYSFRYEIRFRKFKRSLKRKEILASDLENLSFFKSLIDQWLKHFNNISIYNDLKPDVNFLTNSKTFTQYFTSMGIRNFGTEKLLKLITDQMKMQFISKQQGYRFKGKINSLISNNELSKENELIMELQGKINNAHQYYSKAS